jgi:uridine kinase
LPNRARTRIPSQPEGHARGAAAITQDGARMKPFLIGIAGGTGSGKTTVARRIYDSLHLDAAVFIDYDAYYKELGHLSLDERAGINFDHPDSLDNDLIVHHLNELIAGRPIEKPVYDFAHHTRAADSIPVRPRDVILVDGILLFAEPRLREMFDLKIFVDTDADVRFIRRLRRDIEERGRTMDMVIEQYLTTVRPMHFEFVEPTKRYADVIIPRGGQNRAGIDVVAARIRERLAQKARDEASGED